MASLLEIPYFRFTIQSILTQRFQPKKDVSPKRTSYELIYKLSGRSEQQIGGLSFTFLPDMILLIPKGYSNRADILEPGATVCVNFTPELPELPEQLKGADGTIGTIGTADILPEYIQLDANNSYKPRFLEAVRIWQSRTETAPFRCDAILCGIFADLIAEREKRYLDSTHYSKIAPAVDYLRAHFTEQVTVSELTALCGISEPYLRQLFQHYIGDSPIGWLVSMRLEYARELLETGHVTVEEAAEASGFHHAGYFSRAYKKRFHISPGKSAEREQKTTK